MLGDWHVCSQLLRKSHRSFTFQSAPIDDGVGSDQGLATRTDRLVESNSVLGGDKADDEHDEHDERQAGPAGSEGESPSICRNAHPVGERRAERSGASTRMDEWRRPQAPTLCASHVKLSSIPWRAVRKSCPPSMSTR